MQARGPVICSLEDKCLAVCLDQRPHSFDMPLLRCKMQACESAWQSFQGKRLAAAACLHQHLDNLHMP